MNDWKNIWDMFRNIKNKSTLIKIIDVWYKNNYN